MSEFNLRELCDSRRLQFTFNYLEVIISVFGRFMTLSARDYLDLRTLDISIFLSKLLQDSKKLNSMPTYHIYHVLKIFLTDKMVINSILLSKVGLPCGVTDAAKTDRYRNTQSWEFMLHIQTFLNLWGPSTVRKSISDPQPVKRSSRGTIKWNETPGFLEYFRQTATNVYLFI